MGNVVYLVYFLMMLKWICTNHVDTLNCYFWFVEVVLQVLKIMELSWCCPGNESSVKMGVLLSKVVYATHTIWYAAHKLVELATVLFMSQICDAWDMYATHTSWKWSGRATHALSMRRISLLYIYKKNVIKFLGVTEYMIKT